MSPIQFSGKAAYPDTIHSALHLGYGREYVVLRHREIAQSVEITSDVSVDSLPEPTVRGPSCQVIDPRILTWVHSDKSSDSGYK